MTTQDAKAMLREIGVTLRWSADDEEYCVNFIGGREATAYYTNDIDDAYGTGVDMVLRAQGIR